tara:strand:- start:1166 stop:1813 length:648 start_codon:yes stop_codon:yes gene_type:complete
MKNFFKKNKVEVLIFLLISISVPFFAYLNEDKNTYYQKKINLTKLNQEYTPIFRSFLNKNLYLQNIDSSARCDANYDNEGNKSFILLKVTIKDTSKNSQKELKKITELCKIIIIKTLEDYIEFNEEVISFFEKRETDQYYKNFVLPIKVEIYNTIFLLNYTKEKINESAFDFTITYNPSSIKNHLINLAFTIFITFLLVIGFIIAKNNIRGKKRR